VDPWAAAWVGDAWGAWQKGAGSEPGPVFSMGRRGSFDIRVGRRVEEGTSLIWHTKLGNGGDVADTFRLHLWVRVLMREG